MMAFSMDLAFVATYLAMILCIAGISTIGYDEHENGYSFLFSLPMDRKTYVKEKFIFSFIMTFIGLALGTAILIAADLVGFDEIPLNELVIFILISAGGLSIICSMMICIELCFGADKGRIAMMIIYGGIAAAAAVIAKSGAKIMEVLDPLYRIFVSMPVWMLGTIACIAVLAFICLMYFISLKKIEKKEY